MDEPQPTRNGELSVASDQEVDSARAAEQVAHARIPEDEIAEDRLAEAVGRLEEVTQRLAAVMAQPKPPVAAIGSPAPHKDVDVERIAEEVSRLQFQGRLRKTVLSNGDHSYRLPLDSFSDHAANLAGIPREAFIHCSPESDRAHIKLIGTSDRQMLAAMEFAKRHWGDDGVILHVEGKHQKRVIEHAVRAGLNIANRDPQMQALVAKERERQGSPLTQNRTDFERVHQPLLERVASNGRKRTS
jgi:hypothetical protein